ncbi:MAG: tyrosine-type recombinase/integrase [Lentilitoribacter sp.]
MKTFQLADGSGTVNLKHIIEDKDRHGNIRLYYRRRGQQKVRLREKPGTKAFLTEYELAKSGKVPMPTQELVRLDKLPEGTFHWLCAQYYRSPEYLHLSDRTKKLRQSWLQKMCDRIGSEKYKSFTPRFLKRIRDKYADRPGTADNVVKALRAVFKFAEEYDLIDTNPASGLKKIKRPTKSFHTWTIDEIEQFQAIHAIGTQERLALALYLYTGQRRSDIHRIGPQHVKDGWLNLTQFKGRNSDNPTEVEIPILPVLQNVIDNTDIGDISFIKSSLGTPYTAESLGNFFRDACDAAGLPHCSGHGLRSGGATLAAENGATSQELMAIYGWKTLQHVELYTRKAQRKKLAGGSMHTINLEGKS